MNPDILTFGEIRISVYPALIAFATSLGCILFCLDAKRQGLNTWRYLEAYIVVALCGFIGGRVLYVFLNWNDFMVFPALIFQLKVAGLTFHGSLIGGITGIYLWSVWRKEIFFRTLDLMAPYTFFVQGLGRVGCFLSGCCFGRVSDLPWAVVMTHPLAGDLSRHPVQLYEFLGSMIIVAILLLLRRLRPFTGFFTFTALALYGILRFITEYFREMNSWPVWMGLTEAQIGSIGLFIFASVILYMMYSWKKAKKNKGFSA